MDTEFGSGCVKEFSFDGHEDGRCMSLCVCVSGFTWASFLPRLSEELAWSVC